MSVVALNNLIHHLPKINTQWESLKTSLERTEKRLRIKRDISTYNSLGQALGRSGTRCLHISSHGHKSHLQIEQIDRHGEKVTDLVEGVVKRLERSNASQLEFVFISACHSEAYARKFADLGVHHVVCIDADLKMCVSSVSRVTQSHAQEFHIEN